MGKKIIEKLPAPRKPTSFGSKYSAGRVQQLRTNTASPTHSLLLLVILSARKQNYINQRDEEGATGPEERHRRHLENIVDDRTLAAGAGRAGAAQPAIQRRPFGALDRLDLGQNVDLQLAVAGAAHVRLDALVQELDVVRAAHDGLQVGRRLRRHQHVDARMMAARLLRAAGLHRQVALRLVLDEGAAAASVHVAASGAALERRHRQTAVQILRLGAPAQTRLDRHVLVLAIVAVVRRLVNVLVRLLGRPVVAVLARLRRHRGARGAAVVAHRRALEGAHRRHRRVRLVGRRAAAAFAAAV